MLPNEPGTQKLAPPSSAQAAPGRETRAAPGAKTKAANAARLAPIAFLKNINAPVDLRRRQFIRPA